MQDVHSALPIGTIIGDRYNVVGLLGKGGFGAVYLVKDQRVRGNLFALKEMIDTSRQERARFSFESELATISCSQIPVSLSSFRTIRSLWIKSDRLSAPRASP